LTSLLLRAGIGVEGECCNASILGLLYNLVLSSVGDSLASGLLGRLNGALGLELSSFGRRHVPDVGARRTAEFRHL
jgi:hypothetical protein